MANILLASGKCPRRRNTNCILSLVPLLESEGHRVSIALTLHHAEQMFLETPYEIVLSSRRLLADWQGKNCSPGEVVHLLTRAKSQPDTRVGVIGTSFNKRVRIKLAAAGIAQFHYYDITGIVNFCSSVDVSSG